MRTLKMLGLAAIAALGLMAFVGAGTASATTLCTTNDSPGCTMTYTAGTVFDSSLKKSAQLTSPVGTTVATCTGSTSKGKTTQTSATWIEIDVEELTWEGCNTKVETVNKGILEIMWTEGNNGIVRGTNNQVTVVLNTLTCTYSTGEGGTDLGTVTGGEEPILKIETKVKKIAGSFTCPAEPTWDAEYVLTEPHALFVRN